MEMRGSGQKIFYFLQLKTTQGAVLDGGNQNLKGI